ncbi:LD-carboxypeptidase [Edaphobacter sp. DSM 109919]|uniref:LD-carboxypeptidase n=1 Tax=Edaphobacter paludis TaxID=3035702 RepID=A0AAU7CVA3_9BACT
MTASRNAMVKPAALRPGATLAVVSPASTPKSELVHQGIGRLQALGYRTVLGKHALDRGPLYYAGTLEHRLEDFHAAFSDASIGGILCTRGGWGSAELLPFLDATLIRANPKAFIAYSDHTALHSWLHNEANLVTFHGPMVAADFAREDGVDMASWRHSVEGDASWSLGAGDGLRVLRGGVAEGVLEGGCLSILAEALGTPFAPHIQDSILFLEDIGTKPYQWDRMLLHLRYSGVLKGARGIVFGDMCQCVTDAENDYLERAIMHSLRDFDGPIAIGLRSGHVGTPNVTLPLGIPVKLDLAEAGNPQIYFLDSAVIAHL